MTATVEALTITVTTIATEAMSIYDDEDGNNDNNNNHSATTTMSSTATTS